MNQSFFRFLLVGIIHTAAGLSIMYLLYHLCHVSYWWATLVGNAIGAVASYILNRTFTFRSSVPIIESVFRFIAVMIVCYYFSYRLSKQLADWVALTVGIISRCCDFAWRGILYDVELYWTKTICIFSLKKRATLEALPVSLY
ncbi:GtrA-like protein [Parageobacillus thermantarcticus]|uniref:GtrA-like protein n=1 Tax=Parageobacillus thermantarcticus TaxID=186116 RepID=A0A1I0SXV5_9BACL|nr:GtrA-like protein [Parageobacillus thermantarcticus]